MILAGRCGRCSARSGNSTLCAARRPPGRHAGTRVPGRIGEPLRSGLGRVSGAECHSRSARKTIPPSCGVISMPRKAARRDRRRPLDNAACSDHRHVTPPRRQRGDILSADGRRSGMRRSTVPRAVRRRAGRRLRPPVPRCCHGVLSCAGVPTLRSAWMASRQAGSTHRCAVRRTGATANCRPIGSREDSLPPTGPSTGRGADLCPLDVGSQDSVAQPCGVHQPLLPVLAGPLRGAARKGSRHFPGAIRPARKLT